MNKFVGLAATFAFLCSEISIATAADDGGWVNCKDGMKMHGGGACSNHGGVLIPESTSTPIDTTKGFTANKTTTEKKTKKQKTAASTATKSTATKKKTVSKKSSGPTARCMDGAMYFSTEHRGACASHGGVRNWL